MHRFWVKIISSRRQFDAEHRNSSGKFWEKVKFRQPSGWVDKTARPKKCCKESEGIGEKLGSAD